MQTEAPEFTAKTFQKGINSPYLDSIIAAIEADPVIGKIPIPPIYRASVNLTDANDQNLEWRTESGAPHFEVMPNAGMTARQWCEHVIRILGRGRIVEMPEPISGQICLAGL